LPATAVTTMVARSGAISLSIGLRMAAVGGCSRVLGWRDRQATSRDIEAVTLDRPHDGIRCCEPLQAASRVSLSRGSSTRPLPGRELSRKIAATRIGGEPEHVRLLGGAEQGYCHARVCSTGPGRTVALERKTAPDRIRSHPFGRMKRGWFRGFFRYHPEFCRIAP
jgi:hypothetical protein